MTFSLDTYCFQQMRYFLTKDNDVMDDLDHILNISVKNICLTRKPI